MGNSTSRRESKELPVEERLRRLLERLRRLLESTRGDDELRGDHIPLELLRRELEQLRRLLELRGDHIPLELLRRELDELGYGIPLERRRRELLIDDIRSLGPRATLAYQSALEAGRVEVHRAQVMLIGQDRAGKTSLKKSLLGLAFDPDEQSTDGIEVDPSMFEIDVEHAQNWQRIDEKPGMSLFGNHLRRIMAEKLGKQIQKGYGKVPRKAKEKTSEQDKVPVEEDSHCESNDAVLEPAIPELKLNPSLPPEGFIDPIVQHLISKTEALSKERHVTLDIWDFAGQYLYYACYPVLLSRRAVYLLIYNLSKGLKDTAQPCVRQNARDTSLSNPNQETNLENLLSWLVSISTMCSTKSNMDEKKKEDLPYSRPPIFIVGTHADKPVQDIREVESEIQEEISGKDYDGHVIRPFFAVDNTKGCSDDGVRALKKRLIEVLKQEPYMGEELPLRWFNFERVVQALLAEKVYYLELGRLQTIIQKVCKIDDEEEVAFMLDFYHKLRVIVKHKDTVVLQAQWLIDVFKQLITIRSFNDMEPRHGRLWKLMEEKGVLSMELVDHVFSKVCREGVIKGDILDMMEMFGLIVKFQTSPTEVKYFVPGQLRSPPTELCKIKLWHSDPSPLYINFPSGFVPYGLFLQILTRCTRWCSENGFKKQPSFFDGAARFFIEEKFNFQLVIICRKKFLKVLLNEIKGGCDASLADLEEVASFVRCFLEDSLQTFSRDLPWFHNLQYELCVECPHCQKEQHRCCNHSEDSCVNEDCKCLLRILSGGQLSTCDNYYGGQSLTVPGLDKWFPTKADRPDVQPSKDLLPRNTQKGSLLAGTLCTSDSQQSLKVALLASEWKSSKGGLSTINRKLAIVLANQERVKVTFLVPSCSKDDKDDADAQNVKIVEVQRRPGYDPLDWLISPPGDLAIDVVLGHGATLGKQAQFIRDTHRCKWVQLVHTEPEELAMHKQYDRAIARGEEKSTNEIDLCKLSDLVVAVGPKLKNSIEAKLRSCEKHQDIFQLTPGIFVELSDVCQAERESNVFRVLTFGRGDSEDFSVKGYDIAPKAIKVLNDSSYRLIFVGAPDGEEEVVASKLLSNGVSKNQLVVRKFVHSTDGLKDYLHEADLAIMPSRTEAFGLVALEAMSAGLPILVSANSGFADVLRSLPFGDLHVVTSEEPEEWAKAISAVRSKDRAKRLEEIQRLRKGYEDKYSWQKQCKSLIKRMRCMVYADCPDSKPSDSAVSRTALFSENQSTASGSSSTPLCPLAPAQNNLPPLGKTQGNRGSPGTPGQSGIHGPPGENSVLESPRLRSIDKSVKVLQNLQVLKHDVGSASSTTDLRDKLKKIASDKGFIVCDNEGSGNCLSHALSEQLDLVKGIKISHEDLRLQLVQYLKENPTLSNGTELFNFVDGYSSWPGYLKKMATMGTWGDHVVLHAAANRFKTSIQVISSLSHNHNQTITPECHSDSIDRLVLGHVHELHYVSLRPRQVQVKDGNPTPDELETLSIRIGDTWWQLGRRLKFDEAELQGFNHDKRELREKAYEMLIRWKQREASNATYLVLFEALCHEFVNRRDLGEKFCCETELQPIGSFLDFCDLM